MDARPLAVLIALSVPLLAQAQLVLPASHAQREGTASTNTPFGRSTASRVQCLYDGSLFAGAGTITAIAFRLDGDQTALQKQVDCEIRMSTSARSLVAMAADFASNRGVDEVVVLPRQIITLPAVSTVATPSPMPAPIALPVPFHYDPANGPLLLEIAVFQLPPGAYVLDATYVCDSPEVLVGPPACAPQQGLSLRVESTTTQVIWGRPWIARALDAPPGANVVFALGTTDVGTWAGLPLPVALDSIGAPGCFVSIDANELYYQTAGADGTAVFAFTVPNRPELLGYWAHFQAGVYAPQFNALGLITSQAKKVQVCGFEPVARLWSNGTAATIGNLEIGTAPVIQVTVQ